MMEKFDPEQQEIGALSLPDEDMVGWINVLREAGFSEQEMDTMLSQLNETYAKFKKRDRIIKKMHHVEETLRRNDGGQLSPEEREILKKQLEQSPEDE